LDEVPDRPIIDQIGVVGEWAPLDGWAVGPASNTGSTRNHILIRAESHQTQPTFDLDGKSAFRLTEWLSTAADAAGDIAFPQRCGGGDAKSTTDGSGEGPGAEGAGDENGVWGSGLEPPALVALFGAVFLGAGFATFMYNRESRGRKRLPSIIVKPAQVGQGGAIVAQSSTSSAYSGGYVYKSATSGAAKTKARRNKGRRRAPPPSGGPPSQAYASVGTSSSGEGSKYDIPVSAADLQLQRHVSGYENNDWQGARGVGVGMGLFGRSALPSTTKSSNDEEDVEVVVANTKAVYYDPSDKSRVSL
jgi:hypothetical protein